VRSGELLVDLLAGRLVRHDDHQRPAPGRTVTAEDLVEVRRPTGVPPQTLERSHLPDHAAPLERDAQPAARHANPADKVFAPHGVDVLAFGSLLTSSAIAPGLGLRVEWTLGARTARVGWLIPGVATEGRCW
jgi:hypothetical protein